MRVSIYRDKYEQGLGKPLVERQTLSELHGSRTINEVIVGRNIMTGKALPQKKDFSRYQSSHRRETVGHLKAVRVAGLSVARSASSVGRGNSGEMKFWTYQLWNIFSKISECAQSE